MLNVETHRTILIQILKDIYTDTSLSSTLGFKGGTALYLFYNLNRFSVDLDFDLLDESKEDFVYEKIGQIIERFGVVKEKYKKRYTLFYILSYENKAQNVKVEISRRSFGSRYEIKNYFGISMQVMVKEDMFAHKLVALLERKRTANRDIFDVWFMLKNRQEINEKIVEKRTGLKLKKYVEKCIDLISKLSEKNILQGIGELIDEKSKAWVKKNLKNEVLFLLKLKTSN